ncbi:MAG TPA: preprotein translocase subunit YajC [Acidimicrobiales bacterium]|jgi:preprotein translocase subunit YajC
MGALVVLGLTFGLLWVLFILPQQRRVRAHQQLVATLEEGDEVVLTAGIFGQIVHLGPEEMTLEVAPGVQLQVARQAVLRRVELTVEFDEEPEVDEDEDELNGEADETDDAHFDSDDVDDNNATRPNGP